MILYDAIGKTYDTTRKDDPTIVEELWKMLQLPVPAALLDIACGSGNYTTAMQRKGVECTGIDISEEMLSKARVKSQEVHWIKGDARRLPCQNKQFDGAICVLATHHIQDLTACFAEAYRVLKQGSSFVLFTFTVEQMQGYWLWEYFPRIMERGCEQIAALGAQEQRLQQAGFHATTTRPFFVTDQSCDRFLYAGKYQPAIYLDPIVRSGISSFACPGFEGEVAIGLARLQADIDSGKIFEIIKSYESATGDYLFIQATKG